MRIVFCLFGIILGCSPLFSQNIQLNFPKFAGREWDLILLQGEGKDTVLQGTIPADGLVLLKLPAAQKGYIGMARWMLRNGGGLDFVLNGESFSVECLSDQPSEHNIVYKGSAENTFLRINYKQQSDLLSRYEVVDQALLLYPPTSELGALLLREKEHLQQQYLELVQATAASPLYAARFHEIVNFTRGIVGRLDLDEPARAVEADRFVRSQLNWPALYTSNHWSGVIYSWVQLHASVIQSDSLLLNGARQILGRLESASLYTDFCDQLVRYFIKFGKDHLLKELAVEVQSSGKLLRKDGFLTQLSAVQAGSLAPPLQYFADPPGDLLKKDAFTLLVFYQSTCGPCSETLDQLVADYTWLTKRGVRVISLSGDKLESEFNEKAMQLPWGTKYWEREGFKSNSFQAYGVQGTPTLFLIDAEGVILSRTAEFKQIKDAL